MKKKLDQLELFNLEAFAVSRKTKKSSETDHKVKWADETLKQNKSDVDKDISALLAIEDEMSDPD